ncbi:MAG: TPR end-of-group domain-containing protein [Candidatus Acidiferrales bacterium]
MGEPRPGASTPEAGTESRLDSWKEIAAYLERDVTTVQRWEKREGMPVHRHLHDKRGSVYAIPAELDAWLESRRLRLGPEAQAESAERGGQGPAAPAQAAEAPADAPRIRFWLALAGVAIVAILAIAYAISRGRTGSAVSPKIRSIAVLPLKNMSGDPGQDYLADGMTDALIDRLSGIRDLRVISRTSVMQFKNPRVSVPEIAKELRVDAIVEGSVERDGNRVRVTAQLIRASTDEHFWSQTYDRELRDVFSLQSDLAQSIAEKIQATITGAEQERLAAKRPVAPEVYENYSKGQFELNNSHNKTDIGESIAYFQAAISQDATFAPAYLGLADAYGNLGTVFIGGVAEQTRPKVIQAAQKALELDPNLAQAHALLGEMLQQEWHWADAEAEYRRALELDPNSAAAHEGLALWMACHGRADEAIAEAEAGREVDPLAVSFEDFGWTLFVTRHYDEAARDLRAALLERPDDFGTLMDLGFVLIADNHADQAIPVLEKAAVLSHRSPGALGILTRAYAHAGRRDDALRLIAELKSRARKGYVPAGAMVNAYLGIGDNNQALAWLEKACQEQSNMLQFVKVHPFFDPIRGDPRFADLLHRVGLG